MGRINKNGIGITKIVSNDYNNLFKMDKTNNFN